MCGSKTSYFSLLEVTCTSVTLTKHKLNVDQVIEKAKKITAIQAYKVTDVTNSPFSGNAVSNATVFAKSFLVLISQQNTEEMISKIPLVNLCRSANYGEKEELNILPINVTKSYVEVATTAGLSTSEVWLLGFHYEK